MKIIIALILALATLSDVNAQTLSLDEQLTAIETAAAEPKEGQNHLMLSKQAEILADKLTENGEIEPAARALRYGGVLAMMSEDFRRALSLFDRSSSLCRAAADQACLGRALNNSAVALQATNGLIPALARLQQASAAFSAAGEAELAATARFNATNIQLVIGDAQGALDAYQALERDYPNSTFALGLLTNKAASLINVSRPDEAEQVAKAALKLAQSPAASEGYLADMRVINLSTLAHAAALRRDKTGALSYLQKANQLAISDGDRFNAALGCLEIYSALNQLADATQCAETVERLNKLQEEATQARALQLAGRAYAAAGNYQRASQLQATAYQMIFEQRRSELSTEAALAIADVGLDERNALVNRMQDEQEQQRVRNERFRIVLATLAGALIAGMIALFFRMRSTQLRKREEAIFAERIRVARELHDTALQGFTAVNMQLRAAEKTARHKNDQPLLETLSTLVRDTQISLAQVRNAVWQMRSPVAASGNLRAALVDWLQARRETQPEIRTDFADLPLNLHRDHADALLRVVQEGLTNAVLHSQASHVDVSAKTDKQNLILTITDNGKGFVASDAAAMGGHWGLLGMRERIEALGGTLQIQTAPGSGTVLTARVPLI
jgi:signal transduction histidine kinase